MKKLTTRIILVCPVRGIALLENIDGKLELPGGKLEGKETFIEAAGRELMEETGLIKRDNELLALGMWGNKSKIVGVYGVVLSPDDIVNNYLKEGGKAIWLSDSCQKINLTKSSLKSMRYLVALENNIDIMKKAGA